MNASAIKTADRGTQVANHAVRRARLCLIDWTPAQPALDAQSVHLTQVAISFGRAYHKPSPRYVRCLAEGVGTHLPAPFGALHIWNTRQRQSVQPAVDAST